MAEEGAEYEKKHLLADEEEHQLEEVKLCDGDAYVVPPPAYEPQSKPVILPSTEFKVPEGVPGGVAMPLPTYDQSEKYEKEGVLDLGGGESGTTPTGHINGTIRIFTRHADQPAGTWLDFTLFFIACTLLSWVGYIFACCLATSIAAQSGAAAGLGMSLIIKTIVVEFQPAYMTHMVQTMCAGDYYYDGEAYSDSCSSRSYNFLRLMFWILGFLGLFLFARGLSVFCHTRGRNDTSRN